MRFLIHSFFFEKVKRNSGNKKKRHPQNVDSICHRCGEATSCSQRQAWPVVCLLSFFFLFFFFLTALSLFRRTLAGVKNGQLYLMTTGVGVNSLRDALPDNNCCYALLTLRLKLQDIPDQPRHVRDLSLFLSPFLRPRFSPVSPRFSSNGGALRLRG